MNDLRKIIVTGGSGKAGRATIRHLLEHGYEVLNLDREPGENRHAPFMQIDLTDLGATMEAFQGYDAVVHLAAIPAPGLAPHGVTFQNNTMSTYNVFQAATTLGLQRVVWASSETTLGLPFDREQPDYAPIDEGQTPYPESTYALSKLISEEMARQFSRWSRIPFVALRISNIMEPADYQKFPSYWDDPQIRKWNLWGYVDARDVAQACRLGFEAEISGAEVCIIAAADTCMTMRNLDLLETVYPSVEIRGDIGEHKTLLSIDHARDVLGYEPAYSWRDHLTV